ncbi:MAG: hypothetical protein PHV49_07325 [Alistipes sp.]|nr:hypothetical protein [Alistipes sp.]
MKEKMNDKRSWWRSVRWTLAGALLGILAGGLYWRFVGCSSGSCPITASPWLSMLWGGAMGALLGSSVKSTPRKGDAA